MNDEEQALYNMVYSHDHFYEMSDDHSVWRRGLAAKRRIDAAWDKLGDNVARKIWNQAITDRFKPGAAREMLIQK